MMSDFFGSFLTPPPPPLLTDFYLLISDFWGHFRPSSPLKFNIIYGGSLGKDEIKVGDRVNVKDLVANDGTNKTRSCLGTVRFVGSVDFVKGDNK